MLEPKVVSDTWPGLKDKDPNTALLPLITGAHLQLIGTESLGIG